MIDEFLSKIFQKQSKKNRLVIFIAALGLLVFVIAASLLPFKNQLFSALYPKLFSRAAGITTLGNLNLNATFNSVGVELFFSGGSASPSATLEFKKSSENTWRKGLDLWKVDDGSTSPGPAFYGSALLLDSGTQYDIRVKVTNSDGVTGGNSGNDTMTGTIKTRDDNIPAASTLTPTHYVRANGNDSNNGTSEATAWKTLQKAITSASASAVVQVGPGIYSTPTSIRGIPITLIAQNPAVGYNESSKTWTENDASTRSIIEYGLNTSPAGSGGTNAGVWQQVTFTDPMYTDNYTGNVLPAAGSVKYTLWRWNVPGKVLSTTYTQLGYATSRTDYPNTLAAWAEPSGDTQNQIATAAGFAEKLYTNKTYNYGFSVLSDGSGGSDIWLRMPGDTNPNNYYFTSGQGTGISINAPDSRVSGFEIRSFISGIGFSANSSRGIADHNILVDNNTGINITSIAVPLQSPTDIVIQHNVMRASNLWVPTDQRSPGIGIPWMFYIWPTVNANGTNFGTKSLTYTQPTGIGGSGGRRVVIRYNHAYGMQAGFTINGLPNLDRYGYSDTDINDNYIERMNDDAIEFNGNDINKRAWNNRIEYTNNMVAVATLQYGPVYYFRNTGWRIGATGGTLDASGSTGASPGAIKFRGDSVPKGKLYFINNTFWTDVLNESSQSFQKYTSAMVPAFAGPNNPAFYMRNNIFRATGYLGRIDKPGEIQWDEDYNAWQSSDATLGMRYGSTYSTLSPYRTASGQGTHSNPGTESFITPSVIDNALINAASGDFSLQNNSSFVDAGTIVPNIADLQGVNYRGSAPDLGALESSFTTGSPTPTSTPTPTPTPAPSPAVPSASFSFQSGSSYDQSQEIPVKIMVQSNSEAANTFVAKINFPANLLAVSRIEATGSGTFITNWAEQYYDNTAGTISLAGGVPNPGYKTSGTPALMATIYFTAKSTGVASLSFNNTTSYIYRNSDNANILDTSPGTNIIITPAASSTPAPTATPTPTPDTTAPTTPINLTATAASATQVNLSWTASTDNIGVVGYDIYRNDVMLITSTTATFGDTGLTPGTAYLYKIIAKDAAGNVSTAVTVTVTTPAAATSTPTPTPTPTPGLRGDFNRDDKVNFVDLSVFFTNWNNAASTATTADLNSDNTVNSFDFAIFKQILIDNGVIHTQP